MPMSTSQNCCCQCLCPCSEPQPPPTSTGDHPILAGMSGPVSYGVTAFFPCVLVHMRLCGHPPREEFLFPPIPWISSNQMPLASNARFSGDPSSLCPTPRLGSLMWGSELSLLWDKFWIYLFSSLGLPTWYVWDLILS